MTPVHIHDLLADLVLIAGAACVVAFGLRRVGIPSIAGFVVAGAALGPEGLAWIEDSREISTLAEVGIVLLMFGIGLELSLGKVRRMSRAIIVGGATQLLLTFAAVAAVAVAWGLSAEVSAIVACVVSLSSTAVVVRELSRGGQVSGEGGSYSVAILVAQDLAVVPMVLLLPLAVGGVGSASDAAWALTTALAAMVGVVAVALFVVPRVLRAVADTGEPELFILAVFLICFGTAWVLALAGLSLALGAFLAGLVVSASEYRSQALSQSIPAREVLTSLFFVSVGMLVDWTHVAEEPAMIAAAVAGIIVLKFGLAALSAAVAGASNRAALQTGLALCQVGEFAFVLFAVPGVRDALGPALYHQLTAVVILSMMLSPLLLRASPHLERRLEQGAPRWIGSTTTIFSISGWSRGRGG